MAAALLARVVWRHSRGPASLPQPQSWSPMDHLRSKGKGQVSRSAISPQLLVPWVFSECLTKETMIFDRIQQSLTFASRSFLFSAFIPQRRGFSSVDHPVGDGPRP